MNPLSRILFSTTQNSFAVIYLDIYIACDQNKLNFSHALTGLPKETFFDFPMVFDQQLAFDYFLNQSDHRGMPKLTRSMFRITGMNVVKVEKNALLLEIGLSAVKTAADGAD